jgi:hypothetical protein
LRFGEKQLLVVFAGSELQNEPNADPTNTYNLYAGGNSFAFPASKKSHGIPLQNAKINAALAGFWCAFGLCAGASMIIFYRAGLRGAECCIVRYSRAAVVVEPYDEHDKCEPPR